MKTSAFSLIELMVVIAIVAILAVTAFAQYKKYYVGSRMSQAARAIERVADQSIEYASIHGYYPHADALGLSDVAAADDASTDIAIELVGPLIYQGGSLATGFSVSGESGSCVDNGYGSVTATLDACKLGLEACDIVNGGGGVFLECDIWHDNGIFNKTCYYSYGSITATNPADLGFAGWRNGNLTTGGDFSNVFVNAAQRSSYNNSTCP